MFYVVTIEAGYEREADSFEITHYVEAADTITLFDELEKHPGFMAKELGYVITMVQPITEAEYLEGKSKEKDHLKQLRQHERFQIQKACIVEPADLDGPLTGRLEAETTNCSLIGVGIQYDGMALKLGDRVTITINDLNIVRREAQVVWSSGEEGRCRSGLKWL